MESDAPQPLHMERLSQEQREHVVTAARTASVAMRALASALATCARSSSNGNGSTPASPPPGHLSASQADYAVALASAGTYTVGEFSDRLAEMEGDTENGECASLALDILRVANTLACLVAALTPPPPPPTPPTD